MNSTRRSKIKMVNRNKKESHQRNLIKSLDGALLKEMLNGGAAELRSNIEEVNRLNVFPVPDGDTGDNMLSTIDSGIKAIAGIDTDNLAEVMRVLSHGMLLGARGNSGVILSQFFKGVADGFANSKSADSKALGAALELGVKEAYSTVMTPTEGTILTVAREAVEYAVSKINPNTTIKSFFADFVKELHASVERTPDLLPALKDAGVVDSGGAGLFYLMDGFNRVLRGEKFEQIKETNGKNPDDDNEKIKKTEANNAFDAKRVHFDENTDMKFSYCTELLVQLTRAKCDTGSFDSVFLKHYLDTIGNSVAVVKSGSIIKIHVHTIYPDKVMSYMLNFGEFINVKIENMSLQHSNLQVEEAKTTSKGKYLFTKQDFSTQISEDQQKTTSNNRSDSNTKKHGVIAVSCGDGMTAVFKSLGVDEVIDAKGKKSPSAYDFLESAKRVNAENVFVFPNNKNFILSAEQAAKIAEGFKIHVIPSKNIALGYSAISVMDPESESTEEIMRSATRAMNKAICGYVFTAARDTKCDGIKIKNGDVIGYVADDLVAKSKTITECAVKVCKRLLCDKFMLTIFKGAKSNEEDFEKIKKRIKKFCPDAEIYVIDSGQEIFDYIFGAE